MYVYQTYSDYYKIHILHEEAYNQIRIIFSKYSKKLILRFISSVLMDLDRTLNYDETALAYVHTRYLRMGGVINIIHRRATHLLSQMFYSYHDFSESDSSSIVRTADTLNLYLYANTILSIAEREDYSSDLKVFFNSYKYSNDYIDNFDLQNIFYFYSKFYRKLESSMHFEAFNTAVIEEVNVSLKDFTNSLEAMYMRTGNFDKSIMKENFEIDFDDTYLYWSNRIPKIPIPFEYKLLMEKPIIKSGDEQFIVCSQYFITLAIAKKIYFILRKIDAQKFGNEFGKIVEEVISEYLGQALSNETCKTINLKYDDNKEYGDFGIVMDKLVFLFEIKSGTLSLAEKYEQDLDKFKVGFDNKFVNKGVIQQLKILKEINDDYAKFCLVTGLDESVNYRFIPILLFLDEEFFCNGFNQYLRSRYVETMIEHQYFFPNIISARVNSSLILNELKSAIEYHKDPQKILYSIYFYAAFYNIKDITYKPYEFFVHTFLM